MGACRECGGALAPGDRFCGDCGQTVQAAPAAFCVTCGARLGEGEQFCGDCGTSVASAPPIVAVQSPTAPVLRRVPRWQGKHLIRKSVLVVLACTLVGSSAAAGLRLEQRRIADGRHIVHYPALAVAAPGAVPTTAPSPGPGPATSPPGRTISVTAQPGLPPGGTDIAARAQVTAPPVPPPGGDDPPGFGPFAAQSLVNGTRGGWRAPGDASGDTMTLTFPAPVTIRAVGLDPGDDATSPGDGSDLWPTRRIVLQATATFDDGTSLQISFATDPQLLPANRLQLGYLQAPETSRTVTWHIDKTTSASDSSGPDQTVITHLAVLQL